MINIRQLTRRSCFCLLLLGGALAACSNAGPRFENPHLEKQHGSFWGYLRMRLFGPDEWASVDPEDPGLNYSSEPFAEAESEQLTVTWVGHSTVIIEYQGVTLLTDPIWAQRASPIGFLGPKRFTRPGVDFSALPPVDLVVISHDHYDHLDAKTVAKLGNEPRYFVPTGIDRWLIDEGIDPERVVGLGWWDARTLELAGDSGGSVIVKVQALPSQHFSGRGLFDRNRTLWASWALTIADRKLFFAGDTGYNDVQFKSIGERAGPFDVALLPVGAYRPRDFMGSIHVDPAGAVRIHQDVQAAYSVGVHWGTFLLTAEHPREVAADLRNALADAEVPSERFELWALGERRVLRGDRLTPLTTAP